MNTTHTFRITIVTSITSQEFPSWLQVNNEDLEGWCRQQVESREPLERILNQALSTDRNCIQQNLVCCSVFEARVQEK